MDAELHAALDQFGLATAVVTPIPSGLINRTFLVADAERRLILQWVNPLFAPEVHLDIEAITAHLAASGLVTPRLLRTREGALWATAGGGAIYRLMTCLDGRTVDAVTGPAMARSAARLVARFHRAVATLDHRFHFSRPGAHDTPRHLARLASLLDQQRHHPRYDAIAPLAAGILELGRALPPLPSGPRRIIHGDLKISNLLFDPPLGEALALLDLDTMGWLTLPIELGDAFRSWCNPAGEDAAAARFDGELFAAAVAGYADGADGLLTPLEIDHLVAGTQTIAIELSARFCTDAFETAYFRWDPRRFQSHSEHNQVRAAGQVAVARAITAQGARLEAAVRAAFAPPAPRSA